MCKHVLNEVKVRLHTSFMSTKSDFRPITITLTLENVRLPYCDWPIITVV